MIIAFLLLALLIVTPFSYYIYLRINFSELESEKFIKRFGETLEPLNNKKMSSLSLLPLFMLRRFTFAIVTIFLTNFSTL